jgi:hypothetical protein
MAVPSAGMGGLATVGFEPHAFCAAEPAASIRAFIDAAVSLGRLRELEASDRLSDAPALD